jgi:hypothetical protein
MYPTESVIQNIMMHSKKEQEEKTFNLNKMPEYILKAKVFAGPNESLLHRILTVLKNPLFQSNQMEFIQEWDKSLIISQECGFPKEVFYTTRKVDDAFNFFKDNFFWGCLI